MSRFGNAPLLMAQTAASGPSPGGLWSWGQNAYGQTGLGNTTYYSSPKQVGALTDWRRVVPMGGGRAALGVRTNGTLWSWGYQSAGARTGMLGLGNATNYSSPKQIGALATWATVGGGRYHGAAIKTDGTLWTWGYGTDAALGLGNVTSYSSPKQVGALTDWSIVNCGSNINAAIKINGTLWVWGNGNSGALGLGDTSARSSPVQLGANLWTKAIAGSRHMAAIRSDGTLWTWGYNNSGQLGDGTNVAKSSPVQVGALTDWIDIGISQYAVFGIRSNGTLWSWGANTSGQLGFGGYSTVSSPRQVGALTNWASMMIGMDNGSQSVWAIKTDRTLWAWGENSSGRLGIGNGINPSSPVQVGALTLWQVIGGGRLSGFAIRT